MNRKNCSDAALRKSFFRYAVPSVAGMVVSSLYTIVDGIFVGHGVGELALGAVNIVLPFILLQIAITMLVAIGGANLLSFYKGREQPAAANNVFCQSFFLLMALGLALSVAAMVGNEWICRLLGADDDLLPLARTYLSWMAPFVVVQVVALGSSVFVRNDNSPMLAMVGSLVGSVINIALDYVFIMRFGWGVMGASVATGIGLSVELLVYLSHFLQKRGELRIRPPRFLRRDLAKLFVNGFSSFLMELNQFSISLTFNWVLVTRIGAMGVAAYSIVTYLCSSFNMVLIGIVQGAQPLLSLYHGTGNRSKVRQTYRLGLFSNLAVAAVFILLCLLLGRPLIGLFGVSTPALTDLAAPMLSLYVLGYLPVAVTLMNILYFQATEQELYSTITSFLRCFGFVHLSLAVLPLLLGTMGILLAFLCGELGNSVISLLLYRRAEQKAARNCLAANT